MTRKPRDPYFMEIAQTVAQRGTCNRAEVGAVIVDDRNRIRSTGYVGSPPGEQHCFDVGCLMDEDDKHCIRTSHAEMNAILNLRTANANDFTLYSTHQPCLLCTKVAVTKGIRRIIYLFDYYDSDCETYLNNLQTNVEVIRFDSNQRL